VLSPNQERTSVLFVATGQRSKLELDVSPAWSRQSPTANAASWSSEIGCGEDPTGISLLNVFAHQPSHFGHSKYGVFRPMCKFMEEIVHRLEHPGHDVL
jgi:hypothetical protein